MKVRECPRCIRMTLIPMWDTCISTIKMSVIFNNGKTEFVVIVVLSVSNAAVTFIDHWKKSFFSRSVSGLLIVPCPLMNFWLRNCLSESGTDQSSIDATLDGFVEIPFSVMTCPKYSLLAPLQNCILIFSAYNVCFLNKHNTTSKCIKCCSRSSL